MRRCTDRRSDNFRRSQDEFQSDGKIIVWSQSNRLTPVAGPIFETKIERFFWRDFSGEELLPENSFLGQ